MWTYTKTREQCIRRVNIKAAEENHCSVQFLSQPYKGLTPECVGVCFGFCRGDVDSLDWHSGYDNAVIRTPER